MLQLLGPIGVGFFIFGLSRANFHKLRGIVPIGVGCLFGIGAVVVGNPGLTGVEIALRVLAISLVSIGGWYVAAKLRVSR